MSSGAADFPQSLKAIGRRQALGALVGGGAALLASPRAFANQVDFTTWLRELRGEAIKSGIRPATLDAAFKGVQPISRVLELDRKQPEFTLTFEQYLERVINQQRIQTGQRRLEEHRRLLDEIAQRYRVAPRFIVALWGIETDFGRVTGNFSVIAALATLAYDGRRAKFFRGELMHALKILDEGHIGVADMRGSWAGAMGQNQFMPSSFNRFAVDYDGDGRRDIWTSQADVFASIANYLAGSGWKAGETWGRLAGLPANFDASQADLSIRKSLVEWRALGVQPGEPVGTLPREAAASVILPAGSTGPAYIVFDNYRAIMRWNRSIFFATAAGLLADSIGGV